jgi:hypothetical protein
MFIGSSTCERPAEKSTAKTTFIYFAIIYSFNIYFTCRAYSIKTSAITFKACILPEEGHFIHIKIAFLSATLI